MKLDFACGGLFFNIPNINIAALPQIPQWVYDMLILYAKTCNNVIFIAVMKTICQKIQNIC